MFQHIKTLTIVTASFLVLCLEGISAAGDGFPPYGAWAYGTGGWGVSTIGITPHYHSHYRYRSHFYRPLSFHTSTYYYGWGGYPVYPRVAYSTYYRPYSYSWHLPYYRTHRLPVALPAARVCYSAPIYSYAPPSYDFFSAPCVPGPAPLRSYSIDYTLIGDELASNTRPDRLTSAQLYSRAPAESSAAANISSPSGAVTATGAVAFGADDAAVRYIAWSEYAPAADAHSIPTELLRVADTMFRVGGYRHAATAYAQLHVQYGASDLIFGRRFVAQIAGGDFDQAAVVLASADSAGFHIQSLDLPGGDLNSLFDGDGEAVLRATEKLAAHALARTDDAEVMRTIGVWLQLRGDYERSSTFLAMAEQLNAESLPLPMTDELPAPASLSLD